ncbi:2-(1,2-epoxy-1,2-dihydrophenyl)acetyl-CoA isomerase [Altererythrobacter sp. FM1]|uniref:Enoyl-CoA hydratase/isomerase family protein n=1 Tax=Tsuneonella flava TaxID=2055955 RepID=A0ABX7K948_9SPHN|nr:enoyl-CoA hydratase-related protein [Tsuneonella flava]QSB44780.1 enoyl-CoA hydratase/isomerase family protein [Tsuneonella flava]ROT96503.1 2-(1,2-epoxy-1,2-dihydrophenyl)acetyl-CoA isomerase [Altererythrobacter sp. FM1]
MAYETITAERDGDVLKITLNRPERLNACPPEMAGELFDALREIGDARAVLLSGAGRAFCSGADLATNASSSISGGDRAYASLQQGYNPMIQLLASVPVPVVAAVNGPAAGVGCSIALAADFVISGKSGYFLQAFVNIGLVPDGGSSWMLPRLIGTAQATRMMMLGEKISGEEAERIGLIYKCVEDDALMDESSALATRLAGGPTVALGLMKRTLRAGLSGDLNTTLQAEADTQRIAGNTADAAEGAMAFLQKRKAAFKGA